MMAGNADAFLAPAGPGGKGNMGVNRPKLGQNRGIAQVKFVVAGPQAQVRGKTLS